MLNFKKYFIKWASKRSPRSLQVTLAHRTIYVFPSKQGAAFLLVVLLIWLLGTNYQNNLIIAFSFLLTSLLLVSIIHAFKNLLGLTFVPSSPVHSVLGEKAMFNIHVFSTYGAAHHAVLLFVEGETPIRIDMAESAAREGVNAQLLATALHRGWVKLPRILVKSYFPYGLIRAWAYVDLDHKALVFPQPIASKNPPLGAGSGDGAIEVSKIRGDEFNGFKPYVVGSPLSQVAWKQYARGAGLHLKDYRANQGQQMWLLWSALTVSDTELRLSYLSYWVNYFSGNRLEFGLQLPHQHIELGVGELHRIQALTALALHGWEASD